MSTDISIYLMREGTKINKVIPAEKRGADGYKRVKQAKNAKLDFEYQGWVKRSEPKEAAWVEWLDALDFGGAVPVNQSSGCVLAVETDGRVFALAFGVGHHAIDRKRIEYDFGLRVALNRVQPDSLRELISKTVELKTKEKRTYHHAGGSPGDFAMDLDVEWLRSIAGASQTDDCTAVAGQVAIRLRGYNEPLSSIGALCSDLLVAYGKEPPESLRFAENVRPIARQSPLHDTLEKIFAGRVDSGDRDGLEVIVDAALVGQMAAARIFHGHDEVPLDDLSRETVWAAVDALLAMVAGLTPSKIKLDILDNNGDRVDRLQLIDVVQAELEHDDQTYLRLDRRWLEVSDNYIDHVNQRVRDLPRLTKELGLPIWRKADHAEELDYNTHAASAKGWLLQDQKFLYPGGAKVEPCDLLTEEAHFIGVKEGVSSSCLNHLWGQLSASAELYTHHPEFREKMANRYAKKWAGTPLGDRRPTFVAAIGRKDVIDDLLGRMLVAKINLLDHASRIGARNFGFAIAGFKVVPDPADEKATKKSAKKKAPMSAKPLKKIKPPAKVTAAAKVAKIPTASKGKN